MRDGREGRVVPPGDPTALAEALVALAQDDTVRAEMSAAARRRSESYDIRGAVHAQERVYAELAAGGASAGQTPKE